MNTFLIVLIALKAVCLVVCWKGISFARKRAAINQTEDAEVLTLQKKMSELLEQNNQLTRDMNALKDKKREIS